MNHERIDSNFPFPDHRFRNFQFSGQNHSCTHTHGFRGSLIQSIQLYKLWGNRDRFDPHGIHTFKMNRSGPWRIGKHENFDLRGSKLISRDLCQFWPSKTHFKRSTESENTQHVSGAVTFQNNVCSDRLWHHFTTTLFLMNPLRAIVHVELKTWTHFFFKKHTFQVVHMSILNNQLHDL